MATKKPKFDENDVINNALCFCSNFIVKGEEPSDYLWKRMQMLATAHLQGRGAKITLPGGAVINFSTIRGFVNQCARDSEKSFDGPLDIMDRRIGNFCSKYTQTATDRKWLDDLCYDVNTLDL